MLISKMSGVIGLAAAAYLTASVTTPSAKADPATEQQYLSDLYQYVHPSVTAVRLVELGNLACSVRRSGLSSDDATEAVWQNLNAAGVVSSNAEMGTLVHVAVDNLCPDVGYP